jgi:hypothetical protein
MPLPNLMLLQAATQQMANRKEREKVEQEFQAVVASGSQLPGISPFLSSLDMPGFTPPVPSGAVPVPILPSQQNMLAGSAGTSATRNPLKLTVETSMAAPVAAPHPPRRLSARKQVGDSVGVALRAQHSTDMTSGWQVGQGLQVKMPNQEGPFPEGTRPRTPPAENKLPELPTGFSAVGSAGVFTLGSAGLPPFTFGMHSSGMAMFSPMLPSLPGMSSPYPNQWPPNSAGVIHSSTSGDLHVASGHVQTALSSYHAAQAQTQAEVPAHDSGSSEDDDDDDEDDEDDEDDDEDDEDDEAEQQGARATVRVLVVVMRPGGLAR